jgi:hypothetical protein
LTEPTAQQGKPWFAGIFVGKIGKTSPAKLRSGGFPN